MNLWLVHWYDDVKNVLAIFRVQADADAFKAVMGNPSQGIIKQIVLTGFQTVELVTVTLP